MRIWFRSILKSKTGILLIIILLFAASFRIYGLKFQSLWSDELYSVWISSFSTLRDVFIKGIIPNTHPPAYQVILYFVIKLFGNSESVLRMPSAISGIFAVWGTYLVGKQLYSEKEGLLGAAIMAVSWSSVYYSQQTRSYMLMVASTVFAAFFWVKILAYLHEEKKIPIILSLAYFLFAVFSCYVHYFALAYIALQGLLSLVFFFGKWAKVKYILLLYLLIALAYLPWLPSFIYQLKYSQWEIAWIVIWVPQEVGLFFLDISGDRSQRLTAIMLLMILIYLGYSILSYIHKRNIPINSIQRDEPNLPISPDLLLVLWFILPVAITYGVSISLKPIFVDRYLLFVLPAGYLLLARSILGLPLKAIFKGLFSGLLVGLLFYILIFTWGYYNSALTEPFRTVARYIIDSHINNSIIITNDNWPYSFEYYFNQMGSNRRVDLRFQGWAANPAKAVPQVIEEHNSEYIWYIKQIVYGPNDGNLRSYLDNSFRLVQYRKFITDWQPGFDVYLYSTRGTSP